MCLRFPDPFDPDIRSFLYMGKDRKRKPAAKPSKPAATPEATTPANQPPAAASDPPGAALPPRTKPPENYS